MNNKLSIYIAGPDVFELNAIEIGTRYTNLCKQYGFKGLYPLDNKVNFNQDKKMIAQEIFIENKKLIEKADIVIANLNPFRGFEADSGTVWECGYALGLGKDVYGYMDTDIDYIDRFKHCEKSSFNGQRIDKKKRIIEDFNHPINLMIACSVKKIVAGSFEDVLKSMQQRKAV